MFKKLLALAVAVGIIAGGVALFRVRHTLFSPDFDRAGGTELVFEVKGPAGLDDLDRAREVLHRRFDDGSAGVRVESREGGIAVLVPHGKQHDELVLAVRQLGARRGRFEFRFLSNEFDDRAAADQAGQWFLDAKNPLPVPASEPTGATEFAVGLGTSRVRYRWFRLSEALARTSVSRPPSTSLPPRAVVGAGHYSVFVANRPKSPSPDVFAVAREPEDGQTPTGDQVRRVRMASRHHHLHASLEFTFEPEGLRRLRALDPSSASGPVPGSRGGVFAGILDGEVVFTHWVFSALDRKTLVEVNGSAGEIADVVMLIRGGELPVTLAPKPSERVLPPRR